MSRVGYASVGGGTFGVAAFVSKFNTIHLVLYLSMSSIRDERNRKLFQAYIFLNTLFAYIP